MIVGAASGALAGKFADVGVDNEFIDQVRSIIQPGQSALFLLIERSTPDKGDGRAEEVQGCQGSEDLSLPGAGR